MAGVSWAAPWTWASRPPPQRSGRPASYPNGDRTAYVTAVYEAWVITGSAAPGDGELSELAWSTPGQLPGLQLSRFSRALLHAVGRL
jgi:hypothetical protein